MDELNAEQLKRISEILGNIAVAWFTVGVVTPLLTNPEDIIAFIRPFVLSLWMTGVFSIVSLSFLRGVRS